MSEVNVQITGDAQRLLSEMDKAIAKEKNHEKQLHETATAGGEIGDMVADGFKQAEQSTDKSLQAIQKRLRGAGKDGRAVAAGLTEAWAEQGKAGRRSVESLIADLDKLDPASAEAARAIVTNMEMADRDDAFNKTLRGLRSLGPAGKDAAEKFEMEMAAAGVKVEGSIDDVLAELRKIDPESAKQAKAFFENSKASAEKSESAFGKFGKSAVGQLAAVAGGYIGVGEAVQAVTVFMEEQQRVARDSADLQLTLAESQQEALKNLAGLSPEQRKSLLDDFVPGVAAETAFSDLSQLNVAVGSAVSAGGSVSQSQSAVRAAAQVTRLTPDAVDDFAAAAIDLARATGSDDARENLGFLLSAGTQSRVVDPAKLARNLAPTVVSATQTVPLQDQQEASRQAAALFGVLSKSATDTEGNSTATATIQLANKLSSFFGVQENDPGTLFGRLDAIRNDRSLSDQFFEKDFGEERFRNAFKALASSGSSLSTEATAAFDGIRVDRGTFESVEQGSRDATFSLQSSFVGEQLESSLNKKLLRNRDKAVLQSNRDDVAQLLGNNRPLTGDGVLAYIGETGIRSGLRASGGTAAEELPDLIELLQDRIRLIESDGIQSGDAEQIANLREGGSILQEGLLSRVGDLAPGSLGDAADRLRSRAQRRRFGSGVSTAGDSFERLAEVFEKADQRQQELIAEMRRSNQLAERNAAAAETTATNTATNPAAAQQNAADRSNNRPNIL